MLAGRNLTPAKEIDRLRGWARGEFYPMCTRNPSLMAGKSLPFAALLNAGGESLREEVAEADRTDPRLRNAFWDAMD